MPGETQRPLRHPRPGTGTKPVGAVLGVASPRMRCCADLQFAFALTMCPAGLLRCKCYGGWQFARTVLGLVSRAGFNYTTTLLGPVTVWLLARSSAGSIQPVMVTVLMLWPTSCCHVAIGRQTHHNVKSRSSHDTVLCTPPRAQQSNQH